MLRLFALGLALVLAALPAAAAGKDKTTVYTHVNVIDGSGAPLKRDMAIVTRAERIVAVVPADKAPPADDTVDLHGAYALPGLINTHVHMSSVAHLDYGRALLRRDLYSGITAVRDMAGDARQMAYLARQALVDGAPSPDIYYAALVAGPEFFKDPRVAFASQGVKPGTAPWMQAIDEHTDIPLAIARAVGTSATGLKIYADLPPDLVRKLTAEAHRQGLIVWDHAAVFPTTPREGIESGVDVDSHVCMLAYQASARIPHQYHNRAPVDEAKFAGDATIPVMRALFAEMKQRHIVLDATLTVYKAMWDEHKPGKPDPYCTLGLAEKLARQAHAAGVEISTGTDNNADWRSPWPELYDELALLVHHAGMTPLEAIRAATYVSAKTVGQQDNMGTIAPGKFADLMVVTGNPLDDIANLRSVTLTIKRGKAYPRNEYKPITAHEARDEDE